jgi:hypothetical protein
MHILIPHAAPPGPQCRLALNQLKLPRLQALLAHLERAALDQAAPGSPNPLHEWVHATALGLQPQAGRIPWAALQAVQLGLPPAPDGQGWGQLTLCHWQINADHVEMFDPAGLQLSAQESDALFASMQPFFEQEGIRLHPTACGSALICGEALAGLSTASLENVLAEAVDAWMPASRLIRRLQNEMQMLFYSHPVNDARLAHRQTTVNAFWISGTGDLPAGWTPTAAQAVQCPHELCAPALRDDATAWTAAWHALDAGVLAELVQQAQSGQSITLTLCGPQAAQSFHLRPQGLLARLRQRLSPPNALHELKAL